ncbi:MAG: aldo/keto reductase [Bacteroidales bacterium]|nr:aldo/keto reductase [Bacteroidales bacterium]MEE0908892.1 aldo/keto reductase [Muribaculaceae bacterium]
MDYIANPNRYADGVMNYRQCGNSGIKLPEITLGFWWNYGDGNDYNDCLARMTYAFDNGITCFDLANNYGPPFGAAESNFGKMYTENFKAHRHEMIITTKAGYNMWEGPYGCGSSRKMLITSLNESLQRMKLDYVDIFYSHRYDGSTPIEETMQALIDIVRSGKALYVGLSNYPADKLVAAVAYLRNQHVNPIIYQGKYNMLVRDVEERHFDALQNLGIGFTAFSPLAQGILSGKYIDGIPADSRAACLNPLMKDMITTDALKKVQRLKLIAETRGQTLAQMAVAWILAKQAVTSVIVGSRTVEQLADSIGAVHNSSFTAEELLEINQILL